MLDNLKPLIEKAVDFCKENTETILICGGAIVGVILLISIIKSMTRKDEEDLDFDEMYFIKNREKQSEEEPKQETAAQKIKAIVQSDDKEDEISVTEPAKEIKPNVIFPDELLEELSKLSTSSLKEVEIKIQSAELKFKYTGAGDDRECAREEVKVFGEKSCEDETNEQLADTPEVITEEAPCKEIQPELNPEEIKNIEGSSHIKFGANNFNVSKSGKVFTEEELEKQIRD